MPDYSFTPQFANLSGLQPLQPIDVTRGGALQFQPLAPIEVLSSRPELVSQAIAGAVKDIGQGALSGITARWEKKEARDAEQRKYAHELNIAKTKSTPVDSYIQELKKRKLEAEAEAAESKSSKYEDPYIQELKTRRLEAQAQSAESRASILNNPAIQELQKQKMQAEIDLANARSKSLDPRLIESKIKKIDSDIQETQNRINKSIPSGFFSSESNAPIEGQLPSNKEESLPEVNPMTGENVKKDQARIDFYTPLPDTDISNKPISDQAKTIGQALQELTPEYLTASTDGGIIAPIESAAEQQKPALTLQGIDASFISPEKGKQIAEARLGLRETLKETPKKPSTQELGPGLYPVRNQQEANKYLQAPLAPNVQPPKLTRLSTGEYAYEVLPMTQDQIAEKQMKEQASKLKQQESEEKSGYLRTRSVQKALTDFQKEPSIRILEDNKQGIARFASKVPELYNEYEDLLSKADQALKSGNRDAAASYRRQAVPLINSIFDQVVRLESGKSVTEGQTKLFKDANDMWQQFQKGGDALFIGGKLDPRENIEGLVRTTMMSGNQAAQKANFFMQDLRDLGKESNEPEANLAKYYPVDISFSKDIPTIARNLKDEIIDTTKELQQLKEQKEKDEYTNYNIDVLQKQLQLLEFRKKTIEKRAKQILKLKEKGQRIPAIVGFNEWYDRPVGIASLMRKALPPSQNQTPEQ